MNKMQVQSTSASKNPQIELASSSMPHSLLQPSALAADAEMLKINLFKSSDIITGSISKATTIIAIIPQEFLIIVRLDEIVLNASFTVEPTTGIKLLIANFAVLIDKLSAVCDMTFLHDRTNINTDIMKTVTPVKVFFSVFEMPLKSYCQPKDLMIAKPIHMLTIGSIKANKNLSTTDIKRTNEAFAIPPLVIFPVIIYNVAIKGAKHSIILHRAPM